MRIYLLLIFWLFFLSFTGLSQVKTIEKAQEEAFQLIFTDKKKASLLIDSLISKETDFSDVNKGRHYSLKGVYFGIQNELDSATLYFSTALKLVPKEDDFYPKLVNNLAITQKKRGNYQEALNLLLEALEVAVSSNNLDALHKIYSEMSSTYRALNNYNLAVDYSLKAIETESKKENPDPKNIAFEKQKIANLYGFLRNYKFAENIYEEIITYFESSPYTDANVSTYLNYANALIKLDNIQKASIYIDKAKVIFEDFTNDELFAFLKLTEANYFSAIGENEKAKECFETSLANFNNHQDNYLKTFNQYLYFLTNNHWFEEIIALEGLQANKDLTKFGIIDLIEYNNYVGNAYERLMRFDQSSRYYKETIDLKDSLQKLENFQIAKDLQAKYQNEIIQQKNLTLQEKVQSEARKNLAILGFSLFIGVLLLSLILRFRIQLKNKTRLSEVYAKKIEAEEQLVLFKDTLLEEQKKELLSKSLETASLAKKLNSIKSKIGASEVSVKENLSDVEDYLKPENEIKKLTYEFQRAYPNFETQLKDAYPNLNRNDILFLSFIKLKFSFKDIATILNITHQSVITKKYRIAKKLQLTKDDDIYDFIHNEIK